MTAVIAKMSMSLDGFIADPSDGVEHLLRWYGNGEVPVPTAQPVRTFRTSAASAEHLREAFDAIGALVSGRRLFDLTCIDAGAPGRGRGAQLALPVVTIGLARVYLRERIERLQQIGIAMCLSGVVAISSVSGGGFAEIDPHEAKPQQVSAEERAQSVVGIRTLRRLSSEAVVSEGGEVQNVKSAASGQ